MGSDYSFYVKTIETHAHAFLALNILAIGRVTTKVCPIENNTNLDSILYLIKVSKIDFIVLPASYLSISL